MAISIEDKKAQCSECMRGFHKHINRAYYDGLITGSSLSLSFTALLIAIITYF